MLLVVPECTVCFVCMHEDDTYYVNFPWTSVGSNNGFPQFCSFSKDASLMCRAINQLQATGENYETFGKYVPILHW